MYADVACSLNSIIQRSGMRFCTVRRVRTAGPSSAKHSNLFVFRLHIGQPYPCICIVTADFSVFTTFLQDELLYTCVYNTTSFRAADTEHADLRGIVVVFGICYLKSCYVFDPEIYAAAMIRVNVGQCILKHLKSVSIASSMQTPRASGLRGSSAGCGGATSLESVRAIDWLPKDSSVVWVEAGGSAKCSEQAGQAPGHHIVTLRARLSNRLLAK